MAVEGGWVRDESYQYGTTGSGTLSQYFIARSTAQGIVQLCVGSSGGNARPVGVVQNDPLVGQAATVRLLGFTKISAGGTITAGDLITATTGGQALSATTTGQLCIGYAVTGATAASQVITANLTGSFFFTAGATA